MRLFVCLTLYSVTMQIGIVMPPSWLMAVLAALALVQDLRDAGVKRLPRWR